MGEWRTTETATAGPADPAFASRQLAALERAPLFQALSRRHRHRVAGLAELIVCEDGVPIIQAGSPGDAFYVVLDGEAVVRTPDGQERGLVQGDHFGELSLIDGAPHAATVSATGRVTVACISRVDFQALVHEEPGFAVGLLPGLTMVLRDLLRADAASIPDHGGVGVSAEGDAAEASCRAIEDRDALGWLMLLRHVGVFEALPERDLHRIARFATIKAYPDDSTIVLAGAPGDALYIILNGRARVRTPGGHSRSLGADDCFGELCLIDGAPRSATVSAVGELTAAEIRRADFQKLLKSEPAMAVGLLDGLVKTVRDVQSA